MVGQHTLPPQKKLSINSQACASGKDRTHYTVDSLSKHYTMIGDRTPSPKKQKLSSNSQACAPGKDQTHYSIDSLYNDAFFCFCTPYTYCLFTEQYAHILSVETCFRILSNTICMYMMYILNVSLGVNELILPLKLVDQMLSRGFVKGNGSSGWLVREHQENPSSRLVLMMIMSQIY